MTEQLIAKLTDEAIEHAKTEPVDRSSKERELRVR